MGLLSSSLLPLARRPLWWVVAEDGGGGAVSASIQNSYMNLRTGLRIGMVAGVVAAFIATACNAAMLLFQRYVLHMGKAIDDSVDGNIKTMVAQMGGRMAQTTPEAQAQLADLLPFSAVAGREGLPGVVECRDRCCLHDRSRIPGWRTGGVALCRAAQADRSFLTSVSSAPLAPRP